MSREDVVQGFYLCANTSVAVMSSTMSLKVDTHIVPALISDGTLKHTTNCFRLTPAGHKIFKNTIKKPKPLSNTRIMKLRILKNREHAMSCDQQALHDIGILHQNLWMTQFDLLQRFQEIILNPSYPVFAGTQQERERRKTLSYLLVILYRCDRWSRSNHTHILWKYY